MDFVLSIFDFSLWISIFQALSLSMQTATSFLIGWGPGLINLLTTIFRSIVLAFEPISGLISSGVSFVSYIVTSSVVPIIQTAVSLIASIADTVSPVFYDIKDGISALRNFLSPVIDGFASIMQKIIKFFGG